MQPALNIEDITDRLNVFLQRSVSSVSSFNLPLFKLGQDIDSLCKVDTGNGYTSKAMWYAVQGDVSNMQTCFEIALRNGADVEHWTLNYVTALQHLGLFEEMNSLLSEKSDFLRSPSQVQLAMFKAACLNNIPVWEMLAGKMKSLNPDADEVFDLSGLLAAKQFDGETLNVLNILTVRALGFLYSRGVEVLSSSVEENEGYLFVDWFIDFSDGLHELDTDLKRELNHYALDHGLDNTHLVFGVCEVDR